MVSDERHVPTIVTGFYDVGRSRWGAAVEETQYVPWLAEVEVPKAFARSAQVYLDRFAHLAAIKNPMVVFTEPQFTQFVRDARAAHGLLEQTYVIASNNPFSGPSSLDQAIARTRLALGRPEYGAFVARPWCPEHWNAHYVVLTMFKFVLVNSAIRMGLVRTSNLAWIDFGYCRDDKRFDKTKPWSFACGDRIHLFYIREPDERPIFDIVRSGDVYFMGNHIVSPVSRWADFLDLIERAFESLLDCGIPDDEQTALLMACRRRPDLFHTHSVDPADWFVIFQQCWN